ncbi:type IV secretory system conjugative DNA transfer family protein [Parvularcula marina]|uniref:Type IV secretory system conjugative DNA transfer family protein n=1 Tax=Parvularcula marina TaxID=2292771 RepID=A0A371RLA8_9PROT|nr:type IV secretory system conjugative DNA transfer family protein [Parvularcula marina]RFB06211.1 type IV secretory system conjugative DNA transfer family protein [Parvularcula marina]
MHEVTLPRGYEDEERDLPEGHTVQATARWMGPYETEAAIRSGRLRYADAGFWVGRSPASGEPIAVTDDRHSMLIAGSRAGKGRSCIVPNLCLHKGSAIIVDPKGESVGLTAARRGYGTSRISGLGQNVKVLDPFGVSKGADDYLAKFNPLDMIKESDPEACEIAELIADAIVLRGSDKDAHWDDTCRSLIQAVELLVATDPEFVDRRSLVTVKRLIQGTDPAVLAPPDSGVLDKDDTELSPFFRLMERMEKRAYDGTPVGDIIGGAVSNLINMGSNEFGSVMSTVNRNLKFLDSPGIQACISGENDWKLDELKTDARGLTVYLVLPQRYMATHNRWLRMLITLTVTRMEAVDKKLPKDRPVLMVLDEFSVLGYLKILETSAGYMAGYDLKMLTVIQDLSQLKRHYKDSWETFLGNAGTIIAFGNTDLTTLEHLSKRLGEIEIETVNRSISDSMTETIGDISASEKAKQRRESGGTTNRSTAHARTTADQLQRTKTPLMTTDEIRRHFSRESGLQMVLLAGAPPIVSLRTNYDQDRFFHDKWDVGDAYPAVAP